MNRLLRRLTPFFGVLVATSILLFIPRASGEFVTPSIFTAVSMLLALLFSFVNLPFAFGEARLSAVLAFFMAVFAGLATGINRDAHFSWYFSSSLLVASGVLTAFAGMHVVNEGFVLLRNTMHKIAGTPYFYVPILMPEPVLVPLRHEFTFSHGAVGWDGSSTKVAMVFEVTLPPEGLARYAGSTKETITKMVSLRAEMIVRNLFLGIESSGLCEVVEHAPKLRSGIPFDPESFGEGATLKLHKITIEE